jgi:hypothetical protein
MAAQIALGKVICFRCRHQDCFGDCPSHSPATSRWKLSADLKRATAWLGGACIAGSAFGVVLALLFGG